VSEAVEQTVAPGAQQPVSVQEYVDSAGHALRVDAAQGVLRGVKLLGLRSRNARRYEEAALGKAVGLYEGAKVNVNHPERSPLAPRDYRDRLGVVRNVRLAAGEGLFGDLWFNPKHELAERLAWDAEHAPENVGLSHNVLARTRRDADGVVVEAITRVQSVDLVADPATTRGLFEQSDDERDEVSSLREEVGALREQLRRHERRALVDRAVARLGLDDGDASAALTERLARRLMDADEADVANLVEEGVRAWRGALGASRPVSREQRDASAGDAPPADAHAFVEAITRRR